MAGSSNIFDVALTGLRAAQWGMNVTSQNITNANVDGYARQTLHLTSDNGVAITGVLRQQSSFLDAQVLTYSSSSNQQSVFATRASQIDGMFGDESLSVNTSIQGLFEAVHGVAANPSYMPARQVMMSNAQTVVDRFRTLGDQLSGMHINLNTELSAGVSDLNSLASSVADLNKSISLTATSNEQFPPNDLITQRDALIKKISEYVSIQTIPVSDGTVNVMIGQGQPLVLGQQNYQLTPVVNSIDPSALDIAYVTNTGPVTISSQLGGGKLGGLLAFRDQVLFPTMDALGRVAIGLAATLNDQHREGMDLNGNFGSPLFSFANPSGRVVPDSANTGNAALTVEVTSSTGMAAQKGYELSFNGGAYILRNLDDNTTQAIPGFPYSVPGAGMDLNVTTGAMAAGDRFVIESQAPRGRVLGDSNNTGSGVVTTTITDVSQLDGAEYDLNFNGTNYTLRNLTTNATTTIPGATTFPYDVPGKGFQINVSGSPAAKDHFVIQPTRLGAQSIGLAISTPDQIAAANPLRATADITNLGSATITAPTVVDETRSGFSSPMRVVISGVSPDRYDLVDTTTNTAVLSNQTYSSTGTTVAYNGWQVTLSGAVRLNDKFDIAFNANGVGDGSNANVLASLQDAKTMDNGRSSFQGAYGSMVTDVGTRTRQAKNASDAQTSLLEHANQAREQVSGVNLDEEAAQMLRYQQLYQATAKAIAVANETFQALLGIMR